MKTTMQFRNAIDMQLQTQNVGLDELQFIKSAWERDIAAIDRLVAAGVKIRLNNEEDDEEEGYTATFEDGRVIKGSSRNEIIRKILDAI